MRADKYFAEKFGSRTKAKEALEKGFVWRGDKPLSPDAQVEAGDLFSFHESEVFVSNGGYKLAQGLDFFGENVADMTFADLGASTGGFTDCLLRRGVRRVYCVDVGESQLHPDLAGDSRIVVMDRTNARYLKREHFPEQIDGVVSDLSFISLKLVIPSIREILPSKGKAFLLFKPQFECEGIGLGKSGILPIRYHAALLRNFYAFCMEMNMAPIDIVNAPIREKKNIEYVVLLQKNGNSLSEWEFLRKSSTFFR